MASIRLPGKLGTLVSITVAALAISACSGVPEHYGKCPQPRFTGQAPDDYLAKKNPLEASDEVIRVGQKLFQHRVADNRIACARCHGSDGDGVGPMSHMFDPTPRNFTCTETINGVPDGQLFWVIQNGSPGTSMPPFKELEEDEIWSVIHYIRGLANGRFHGHG